MPQDIALSFAIRANLLSLANTQELVSRTQGRLSTGLRVASAIDDARAYFEAKSLSNEASDINEKKEGIDQAISAVTLALNGAESIERLVAQMKGIAIGAKTATGNELIELQNQFNELRTQIDLMAQDTAYQGRRLIAGTGELLRVSFSNDSLSVFDITSVDLTVGSLGLGIASVVTWAASSDVDTTINEITAALSLLRGKAQALGSSVAVLQTRLKFTSQIVNTLDGGAAKLTLADINEEGANLVALQVRQQLGIQSLAFAGQSEQAVLGLFR
jgi:flagellin